MLPLAKRLRHRYAVGGKCALILPDQNGISYSRRSLALGQRPFIPAEEPATAAYRTARHQHHPVTRRQRRHLRGHLPDRGRGDHPALIRQHRRPQFYHHYRLLHSAKVSEYWHTLAL